MIVGKEGLHICSGVTLNNLIGGYPKYQLESIVGLRALPDFDAQNEKATGRTGEIPRGGTRGGKSITYEGNLKALNIVQFVTESERLPSALASTGELKWTSKPHASDPHAAELPERWFYARTIDAVVSTDWAPNNKTREQGFISQFSVVIRMSDPRFYHPDPVVESSSTLTTLSGTGTPIDPGGAGAQDTDGVELTVMNAGNYDTEAILTVENTGTTGLRNPVVSNETTGKFLRFRDLTLDPGEGITIDSRRRRVVRFSGINQRHKLDPTLTWWDRYEPFLVPKANDLQLRGWKIPIGSKLQADFYSADVS